MGWVPGVQNRRYTPGSRNDPRMKAMLKRFNRKLLPVRGLHLLCPLGCGK